MNKNTPSLSVWNSDTQPKSQGRSEREVLLQDCIHITRMVLKQVKYLRRKDLSREKAMRKAQGFLADMRSRGVTFVDPARTSPTCAVSLDRSLAAVQESFEQLLEGFYYQAENGPREPSLQELWPVGDATLH